MIMAASYLFVFLGLALIVAAFWLDPPLFRRSNLCLALGWVAWAIGALLVPLS